MEYNLPSSFLERLKQHYIFRIAAIYAVASWVLIQASSSILPVYGFPKDGVRFVIIVVTLGFPVMLVLTWTFIKPSGIEATDNSRWTRLRLKLGSALSLIIIVLVFISGWYLWGAAETAHQSQIISENTPTNTEPAFNPEPLSIAVLPFINQSDDPTQQYFSDGITEEITGALGELPGARVISWPSASIYRGTNKSINDIGKDLSVANILEGSISHDGDRVRVSAELVNTVTGFQLWSAHYDRTFKDVFAIQDDISKAIVSALKLHLQNNGPLVADATTDTNAHDNYLKGLAALQADTASSLDLAIKYFQQAIRIDPMYAEAYAGLARTYTIIHQSTNISLAKSLPLAKRAVNHALQLNPNLASAHATLGMIYMLDQKPLHAMSELHRAMELDPNNVSAHIIYALLLPPDRYKEALAQFQQAVALDPNNAYAHDDLAVLYERNGNDRDAITQFQATLGLAPQLVYIRLNLASLYHRNSDDKSAVDILTGIKPDDPLQAQIITAGRIAYLAQENPDLHNQALSSLRQIDIKKTSVIDKYELVTLYLLVGEKEYALLLLKQACEDAPETCADIAINPSYKSLHDQSGFDKLVKKYSFKN